MLNWFKAQKKRSSAKLFPGVVNKIVGDISDTQKWKNQIIHVKQFDDSNYISSYQSSVGLAVEGEILEQHKTILDFGCWSGITSGYLADLTGRQVFGVDIDRNCIDFANEYIASSKHLDMKKQLSFDLAIVDGLPFNNNSIDLIVANQVFCNMYRPQFEIMLAEFARILSKEGRIIIIDSNNPENPDVASRLKDLYTLLEGKNGSYLKSRQQVIDTLLPNSAPNTVLALATCFKSRQELQALCLAGNISQSSYFLPDSLEPPVSMSAPIGAPSSPTPPEFFIKELKRHSIDCKAGSFYPPDGKLLNEASFYITGKFDN